MTTPSLAMTRQEALQGRAEMLARARQMAAVTANERFRWGIRYEAAVLGDNCLDLAKEYDAFIRKYCREG